MNKLLAVSKKAYQYTFAQFLEKIAPDFKDRLALLSYEDIIRAAPEIGKGAVAKGNLLFTDVDRASTSEIYVSLKLCQALAGAGDGRRVINWPNRIMTRYELLRRLAESGTNRFDVHLYVEARRRARFPVFIRMSNLHGGKLSSLLSSWDEVEANVEHLLKQGIPRDQIMICEFLDTKSPDGLYRKYSCFMFDGALYPGHVYFSRSWNVGWRSMVVTDALVDEEVAFFNDPSFHLDRVKPIFTLSGVQYGRIDYSLLNGEVRTWEIDTNLVFYGQAYEKIPVRVERILKPFLIPIFREGVSRMFEPGKAGDGRENPPANVPAAVG